jgi:RNA polymerase sigma-70 factor (ECF subfamily)
MRPETSLNFETLVEFYYQPVFTFAVKLCGKLEHALELTQHTFCLALEHKSYLEETKSAKTWLFTLLLREFLKEKRLERRPVFGLASKKRPSKRRVAAPILAALSKVREELRTPLILFYAKDFSFSQIADYLGLSVDAVLTLLSKGREELSLAMVPSVGRGRSAFKHDAHRPKMLPAAA